jgi:PQQ-dependent dehydrogenase (methanol/ethanol family)
MRLAGIIALLAMATLAACASGGPDKGEAGGANADWTSHGLDAAETRSSPLDQITPANVAQLKPAWFADLTHIANRAFEATPLVVDGVMYVSTGWSHAFAYDAATGKELWHFDPKVDKAMGGKGCCGPASRGLAYADGRIFLAAFDGRLIALDARTGKPLWTTRTLDPRGDHSVTGAPRAFAGLVLIGNGGAELGVRGYVSAYEQKSGKLVWRFYTVPPKPGTKDGAASDAIFEKVAGTWDGDYWKLGGGGTVWDSMAYDPDLGLVYVGVGNGGPWNRQMRSAGKGDNLFLSSIVALNAKTGAYAWHFQTSPGDEWDYTATQSIILADVTLDGKPRKVLMQAPKNGYYYVLDRATGEFLSGTPFVTVTWSKGLDPKTGRPIENPGIRWSESGATSNQNPGALGGHNWHSMSYSAKTGLAYIPAIEAGFGYAPAGPAYRTEPSTPNMGIDPLATSLPEDLATMAQAQEAMHGELIAWDPVRKKAAWRVRYPVAWNGGTLATDSGLVFQGTATGEFIAYDAASGKTLWSADLGNGIVAAPMTYRVKGEQYVAIAVGWGGGLPQVVGGLTKGAAANGVNRLIVFKLDGKTTLPPVPPRTLVIDPPAETASAAQVDAGRAIYARRCYFCHGSAVVSGGEVPDLRASGSLAAPATFRAIVREGALAGNGMPGFGKLLSDADAEAVRAYIVRRAHQDRPGRPVD